MLKKSLSRGWKTTSGIKYLYSSVQGAICLPTSGKRGFFKTSIITKLKSNLLSPSGQMRKMDSLSPTHSQRTNVSRPVAVNLNHDSNNQNTLRSRSPGHLNSSQAAEQPLTQANASFEVLQDNNNNITPREAGQALRLIGDRLNFRYLVRNNQNG